MLKKYWKKIGMLILIIACVFNVMGKLVHKMSLKKWKILGKYCAYSKKYITYILTIHYISYIIYIQ